LTKCGITGYAYAEIPHLINYQGRLTEKDGKPVTDGTYQIIFRIFDAATAGNLLWKETHSSVLIQKGIFSILLGSVTNLNLAFDKPYYLEIETGDEVMSPRQQITSAGYAFQSQVAETAHTLDQVLLIDKGGTGKASLPIIIQKVGTTNISTSANSYSDMSDMYITSVFNGWPVEICFTAPINHTDSNSANYSGYFSIIVDGVLRREQYMYLSRVTGSVHEHCLAFDWIETFSPGTHTIKIQWKTDGGTMYQNGSSEGARVLSVKELIAQQL
jgi:hypothetical protein